MENFKGRLRQDENGMMVVEAVISFMVFLFVVLAVISLINVYMVHNRIQFAVNSAAHEMSSYFYLYEAVGARAGSDQIYEDGAPKREKLTKTAEDIAGLFDSFQKVSELNIDEVQNQGQMVYDDVSDLAENPKDIVSGALYLGFDYVEGQVNGFVAGTIAEGLMKKYLEQKSTGQEMDADAYLERYGVKNGIDGLSYAGTAFREDKGRRMIDIVVSYDLENDFVKLLGQEPLLHIVQRASVPAWLNGDGKDLSDYGIDR